VIYNCIPTLESRGGGQNLSIMQYYNDNQLPYGDETDADTGQSANWDNMLDLLDDADDFQPMNSPAIRSQSGPLSYSVIRLILRKSQPRSAWINMLGGNPQIYQRNNEGKNGRPYSFVNSRRQSVVVWPYSQGNTIDLVSWHSDPDNGHASNHPESQAVEWLQKQQRSHPDFNSTIGQVKMLIQDEPCNTCLHSLKSSLQKVLPADSNVHIKWIKPRPHLMTFRERRYKPTVLRWGRR